MCQQITGLPGSGCGRAEGAAAEHIPRAGHLEGAFYLSGNADDLPTLQAYVLHPLTALEPLMCAMQVGFSMVMDLWALARALGGEGGSCVAVVTPVIEAGVLHRTLLSRHVPGIAKASSSIGHACRI